MYTEILKGILNDVR